MEIHPAAMLLPEMTPDAFAALKADIKAKGLRVPVVTYGDYLLDGRNRFKACQQLGITPRYEVYEGNDPVGFVKSMNVDRRHLNESQRAMFAAGAATLSHGGDRKSESIKSPIGDLKEITRSEAAKMLNVGTSSVDRARRVQERAVPEIVEMVERGELSLHAAAEVARLSEDRQGQLAAEGPKAVKSTAKRLVSKKIDGGSTKPVKPPKHYVEENELDALLAKAGELDEALGSMFGLNNLTINWEWEKKWKLSERLESLAKSLRKHSMVLRQPTRTQ